MYFRTDPTTIHHLKNKASAGVIASPIFWPGMVLSLINIKATLYEDLHKSDFLFFIFEFTECVGNSTEQRILSPMIPPSSSRFKFMIRSSLNQSFENIHVVLLISLKIRVNCRIQCSMCIAWIPAIAICHLHIVDVSSLLE